LQGDQPHRSLYLLLIESLLLSIPLLQTGVALVESTVTRHSCFTHVGVWFAIKTPKTCVGDMDKDRAHERAHIHTDTHTQTHARALAREVML
jgi:hypothetical protein